MKYSYSRQSTVQVGNMSFDKIFFSAECEDSEMDAETLRSFVDEQHDIGYQRIKNNALAQTLKDKVRFYERNGEQYPSSTSILSGYDGFESFYKDGYAQRGTIVHRYMERYINEGVKDRWTLKDLMMDFPELEKEFLACRKHDIDIIEADAPSVIKKLEGIDVQLHEAEKVVFNDEHKYAGTLDALGLYEGKKAIFDFKVSADFTNKKKLMGWWQQLSSYAVTQGAEVLVVIPLDTKIKGVRDPIVEFDVDHHFGSFVEKRKYFKKTYGI